MTDQEIRSLTAEDYRLITKLAYRVSKKGLSVFYNAILPFISKQQTYPNGFHQLNDKFNAASRQHKTHIPEVWKANQNRLNILLASQSPFFKIGDMKNQNVRKFFLEGTKQISKMRSLTFSLYCPQNLMNQKKFAIHAFQSEFQKMVNPKLKYGQNQLKSSSSQNMYEFRKKVIEQMEAEIKNPSKNLPTPKNANQKNQLVKKQAEQSKGGLLTGLKSSVLFSAGMSAVFNISQLINGNYLNYFGSVAFDTGVGVSQHLLTNYLQQFSGAGLISALTIGTILNVAGLVKSGDWTRFGLNTGGTICGGVLGYGGAKGGAMVGASFGPVGAIAGGIIGGLAGGLLGRWGFSKASGASELTSNEKQQVKKAQADHLKKLTEEINKDLAKNGQKIDTQKNLEMSLKSDKIPIKQKSIEQIYKTDKSYLTSQMTPYYINIIRPIVVLAKAASPTGNISQGLRILIQQTEKFE